MKIRVTSTLKGCFMVGTVVVASLALSSCSKSNDSDSTPVAGVMVYNLATDQDAVGLSFSGNSLNVSIPYSQYIAGYSAVYAGQHTISSANSTNGTALAQTATTFEAGKYYSLMVAGANGNYRNIIINDNLENLSSVNGAAFVRFVNAIPDSAKPTITITPQNSTPETISSFGFGTVSAFREAATTDSVTIAISNGSTIQASRKVAFQPNYVYTIGLLGDPANTATGKQVAIGLYPMGTLSN